MRLNLIIIISCALLWMCSCNSSKNTKTAKEEAASAVENTIENADKKTAEVKSDLVKKKEEATTKLKENTEETKEVLQSKIENTESQEVTPSKMEKADSQEVIQSKKEIAETETKSNAPVKQVNVKNIDTGKTKAAASKKMQDERASLVGKYKWLKRECCGRMRKVTLPEEGQESYMTFTEDGKVLYSGAALKNAENCNYTLDMNFRSFPDRPMLKMGFKIAALLHHKGDTLVIDRGYIDLDKNYWLKVE